MQQWSFESSSVIRIGRSSDNDVVLYSAVVSRHHVEICQAETGWEVRSLGTNGTYVDNKRISQAPVTDGTIVRLARSGPTIKISVPPQPSRSVSQIQALLAKYQRTAD